RVVVTGCYAERAAQELQTLSDRVEVFGNHEKPMIAVALGVPTACVEEAARSGVTALADRTRAYIKIQDGCDAKCTYCIIPSVRPNLVSRPPQLILREATNLIGKGFREIVLTGVRLGRYEQRDWNFARLVLGHLRSVCRTMSIPASEASEPVLWLRWIWRYAIVTPDDFWVSRYVSYGRLAGQATQNGTFVSAPAILFLSAVSRLSRPCI